MITKELIKAQIDDVQDEYLDVLYKIIKALEIRASTEHPDTWTDFIEQTYGCLSDHPIKRGDHGNYEIRGKVG